ncbi:MAG: DUF2520 domain-containing protein [Gammaproteobacteria bacterium]|nr:DUF2520 domain-containing protein [Gammaproteobacteria bacterium]
MRQVPYYLLIGNGRVARHIQHYFSALSLPFTSWQRTHPLSELQEKAQQASHILLLINDDQIEPFIKQHLSGLSHPLLIHFSGSLHSPLAYGAHPLMTFNTALYTLAHYQAIPFIIDDNAPSMSALLPGLPNNSARLSIANKAKYHALCVLSGNLSCFLWQKLFNSLEHEFNIPASFAHAYLMQQTHNLLSDPQQAFTGPIKRNDQHTLKRNLDSLNGDPFQLIYQSFVDCYQCLQKETTA